MLEKLKALNVDRLLDLDEAVSLSQYGRALEAEYGEWLGLPVPEWLQKSLNVLREEIARRTRAADLAALTAVETELESYKTVGEKKTDAQRRLAALQKRLGLTAASK
jgi:hypothetical protein